MFSFSVSITNALSLILQISSVSHLVCQVLILSTYNSSPFLALKLCMGWLKNSTVPSSSFLSCLSFSLAFFFFYFLFILFIYLFCFTILYWFCHISTWIHHRYTLVPHPELPSLLPSRTIPLGRSSAPAQASSIMHRTWTGDSFHIWYYTCFNAILPNHPTLSLSHRVQKPVLYICVSFAVSHTGLLLPSFKFHIYALVYCIVVFLSGLLHSV